MDIVVPEMAGTLPGTPSRRQSLSFTTTPVNVDKVNNQRRRSLAIVTDNEKDTLNDLSKSTSQNTPIGDPNSESDIRSVLNTQREVNIVTALRLMRKVGRPKTAEKSTRKELVKRTNSSPYYTYKNQSPIVLHNIEDIYKEAQVAYHRKMKESPERRQEEEDAAAKRYSGKLRPISASIISEIMSTESSRMRERSSTLKSRPNRMARSVESSLCWSEKSPVSVSLGGDISAENASVPNRKQPQCIDSPQKPYICTTPDSTKKGLRSPKKDRESVIKKRDDRIQEEEQRRLMVIEEKKRRSAERAQLVDLRSKQNMWMVILIVLLRTRAMAAALENKRLARLKKAVRKVQLGAIRRIELFWQNHRVISKMRRNPQALARIRVVVLVYWRRRKVRERNAAIDMIQSFLSDIGGVSDRTQKVYRYRARVVKLQRWIRSFMVCQNARLLILWLSLQKLLMKTRIARNNEISLNERIAVRKMKKTKFFGVTVQKLDEVYSSLSALMSQKQQMYKSLMQQQRHIENLVETRSPGKRNYNRAHSWQRSGGYKYIDMLRSVLWKQRRRHILLDESDWGKMHTKTSARQAVDDADVKEFLTTPGHPGPTYVFNSISESATRKTEPFLLLTGGGLRELEALAHSIVLAEDGSKLGSLRSMASGSSIPSEAVNTSQDDIHGNDVFLFEDDDDGFQL